MTSSFRAFECAPFFCCTRTACLYDVIMLTASGEYSTPNLIRFAALADQFTCVLLLSHFVFGQFSLPCLVVVEIEVCYFILVLLFVNCV